MPNNTNTLFFALTFWQWYILLIVIAIFNLIAFCILWYKIKITDGYSKWCKYLALPWVLECAWRCCFPSLYLQRFVVWNIWMNCVFVDRCWACAGELCWSYQIAMVLRKQDKEINHGGLGTQWVQTLAWMSFFTYVVAECISYYNVATTNEWWAAAEVVVDGISFLFMLPAAVYLFVQQFKFKTWSSGKIFCFVLSITSILYPMYNIFIDAPMYMKRFREDEKNHKKYLPFLKGIVDSYNRRVVTHNVSDWSNDMTWMIAYFLFGAWSGMLLMFAPRSKRPSLNKFSNNGQPLLIR